MSAEMPSTITNSQQLNRPNTLLTQSKCTNCDKQQKAQNGRSSLTNLNTILGKPQVLLQSTTPSPGNVTKIPVSTKSTSLTPSPGMLRRSTSLRLRGDRFTSSHHQCSTTNMIGGGLLSTSPSLKGHQHYHVSNSHSCGLGTHRHDSQQFHSTSKINLNGEGGGGKGSVNSGPFTTSTQFLNTERSPNHRQRTNAPSTPSATRKSPGINKSPFKDIQESPTRQRSLSLSLSTQTASPHTPPVSPDRGFDQDDEDDLDSLHSYSSIASTASCDHAYVARNGTTFSGRKMKYVVHCSSHAGQTGDEYLTPTQRAQRQIRRLKSLLQQAKLDLEQKDSDIFRLTKEVVELRLYKASLNSPSDDKSNSSSEVVTVCENTPDDSPNQPVNETVSNETKILLQQQLSASIQSQTVPPPALSSTSSVPTEDTMQTSCTTDSGHFDDLVGASPSHQLRDKAVETDEEIEDRDEERKKLIEYYENKLQELTRLHGDETQELKRQHNDRVEALLKTLSEVNERYCQLMPDYETAKERIRDLEKQLDDVVTQLKDSEEKQKKIYLKLYADTKDSKDVADGGAVVANGDVTPGASTSTALSRVSVADLLHQLQVTQIELDNIKAMYRRLVEAQGSKTDLDPEVTLQFLKSAIYYFLTDKENHRGHLRAIESILGFSHVEIANINKATNTS
ncbi:uncharacterized protein LOC123299627 isoform X2 [Chrysoperla carnea]|uniref:uncharacterized protein LOC123299627 isoform X2 n=1 Tax=Chrysoperla carnea TaxID=189513 RepID=UPI001D08B487|nr:uncharacterized protein LOC123299627 isoform X2 [Chrysoperla carnea]